MNLDHKIYTQITKELKITSILEKVPEYKINCAQHVKRIYFNRSPRIMKHYSLTGRRNYGISLTILLHT
jgi:hypothetical protein